MRDPFVFDSRSEFCKSPYGAAPCGGRVTFHVRPLYAEGYSRCVLVAWREFSNSADTLELMPEGMDGDRTRFSGVLTVPQEPELIWYYFRLFRPDGSTRVFDRSGWRDDGTPQSWQLTVYEKTATPLWFGGGVVYQIFPDRFCRLSLPDPTGLVGNPVGSMRIGTTSPFGRRTQTARYETGTFSAALSMVSPPSWMIWPLWASPCCT